MARALSDEAYDSRLNFSCCAAEDVETDVRVHRDFSSRVCSRCVRWITETLFFRRYTGLQEYVIAVSFPNRGGEVLLKASLCDLFTSLNASTFIRV